MSKKSSRKVRRAHTAQDIARHAQKDRRANVDIIINEEVQAEEFWNNFALIEREAVPPCLHPFVEPCQSCYSDAWLDDAQAAYDWARAIPGFEANGQPAIVFAFPRGAR